MKITVPDTINLYPESGREEQYLHDVAKSCDHHSLDLDDTGLPVVLRLWRERPRILQVDESDKPLIILQGPGNMLYNRSDARWRDITRNHTIGYLAAHSRNHAVDLIASYRGQRIAPVTGNMLRERWQPGWDHGMEGITPEPGLWIMFRPGEEPRRIV